MKEFSRLVRYLLLWSSGVLIAACQTTPTASPTPAVTNTPLPAATAQTIATVTAHAWLPTLENAQTYHSQSPAYQLSYPAGWQKINLGEGYHTFTGAVFDEFATNLTVFSEESELSASDYTATTFAAVLQSLPDAKIVTEGEAVPLQHFDQPAAVLSITRVKPPTQITQTFYIVPLAGQNKLTLTCSHANSAPAEQSSALCRAIVEQLRP